ncbi:DNA internalization-related competence protein ComEC/Rec2 [Vespertiliibacter pulmonis]|uniref:Competence protein ComEC n=1 Tax=Vespertiliibacter pulmonis TaxID=1443036 RepID=A0A3N4WIZ1_9PAST|nr:DNA internalization-related competence protein ComEC/Rec2 [Vespertiliibacter pulmonis]QLB21464.1 DNA internalization-related competence protein ComEC/Rec2 [Vespertiliibacter pulmonis]RPE85880.1 competence protein ComEC [Vespertiliibacter pulmonis]
MNLDRFCQLFVISLLPLLVLPSRLLNVGFFLAMVCLFLAIFLRCYRWAVLGIIIAISYGQIIQMVTQANKVQAGKEPIVITITQILKQREYRTAIAENDKGERIYLNWQAKLPLQLGGRYQVMLNSRPISGRFNISNFDRQKWYFSQKIMKIATVKQAISLDGERKLLWRNQWFERVLKKTDQLVSQGLLLALAFGERGWLSLTDWQLFQQTSTAHLIAISGLHIALAFGFGIWFAKAIQWLGWQTNCLQAVRSSQLFRIIIGFTVAIGYSYLAGFSVPTLRAIVAISLVLGLQLLHRYYTPWQYWWRTVALLLLFDPMSLLSDSFWLSILAVASLILWYHYFPFRSFLPEKYKNIRGVARFFLALLHLQAGIWLLFLPVQLYFFEGISLFSLLANLLIVPLYSLVLIPLILFSLLTDNFFATWQLADWLAQGSLLLLKPLAQYWITLSNEQQWQLMSFNFFLLIMLWVYQNGIKKWIWLSIFPLLFNRLPMVFHTIFPLPEVRWVNFDVGQGLAMALIYQEQNERKAIVYDTGASWQGGSMAELEIIPYLQRQGVILEALFVSHSDNDHSGGVPALLQQYPNTQLILSQQSGYKRPVEHCIIGKTWHFGTISLQSIYPISLPKRAENADSCVLLVEIGKYRLLFTGDSGRQQEQIFAQSIGKIDFLQVGHHGSNTSTSHSLLAKVMPTVAIISAGRWNPWKLPTKQINKRLEQYQILQFNTAKVGMVNVDFYPDYYEITTGRHPFSPWFREYLGSP